MSVQNESGHAKNVANFEKLITYVIGYGDTYSPSNANIQLSSLEAKAAEAHTNLEIVHNLLANYNNRVGERSAAFAQLAQLSTRIFNALKASGATSAQVETAKTHHRKLQGRRASAKLSDEQKEQLAAKGQDVKQVSASQLSYDSLLDNLDKQIKFLTTVGQYAPNEVDLQIASLASLHSDLLQKNSTTVNQAAALSSARLKRDEVLSHPETGMIALATNTKNYLKSIFGVTSPEYKLVSGIAIR